MCYSAYVWADYRLYQRMGGKLDIAAFAELFEDRGRHGDIGQVVPKAVRDAFAKVAGGSHDERLLHEALVKGYRAAALVIEKKIAEQSEKIAKADAVLSGAKPTKKAANDKRVAEKHLKAEQAKLDELGASARDDGLARIWPGNYLPVLIRDADTGERRIVPMRYRARPVGWKIADEKKKPNCYNARKDSLRTVWRGIFGHFHGVVVASRFYESVLLHDIQQRELVPGEKEQNIEIVFTPEPASEMLLACIWRYVEPEGDEPGFYGVAAVTRDPPPEVLAAGHNRCIIPIRPENLDAWLDPVPKDLGASMAILDDPIDAHYQWELSPRTRGLEEGDTPV